MLVFIASFTFYNLGANLFPSFKFRSYGGVIVVLIHMADYICFVLTVKCRTPVFIGAQGRNQVWPGVGVSPHWLSP